MATLRSAYALNADLILMELHVVGLRVDTGLVHLA